jgi:hypothetical protein
MSDPELIRKQQAHIVRVARKMLDREVGIIEGAREIVRLRHNTGIDDLDPVFIPLIAIDSETDDLPVGQERQFWADDALIEKDKLIMQAENTYRQEALAACRLILRRFQADFDESQ